MVFESPNSTLGGIVAMDMQGHKLEGAVIACDGVLESGTHLIVQDVHRGGGIAGRKPGIGCFVGCNAVGILFGCKWLH